MGAKFEYNVDVDGFFNKCIERSQKKIDKAVDDAVTELFRELKEGLKDVYKEVIDAFYDEYKPTDAGPKFYKRSESLYNLMNMTDSPDVIEWDFDPGKATKFRNGNGNVYELSFIHGYHGGAAGTDKRGMTVSTPHWRTPQPPDDFSEKDDDPDHVGGYFRWGAEAAKSESSPYEEWERKRKEYVATNGRTRFIELLQEHINQINWF